MTSDMQNSPQDPTPTNGAAAGGLPMRGFAMILIAVAVLLGAWALWSMTSKDDSSTVATSTTETQAPATNAGTAASQAPAASDSAAASSVPAAAGASAAPAASGTSAAAPVGGIAAAGAAGGAAAAGTPVTTLYVLNNSTVPQLAARVADELKGDYEKVDSGNLADAVLPENTVFFTPGNPEAETAARELADRVGGVAVERSDILPAETAGNDAIVLVLTQDVAL
ncbi:LytR C-terminal domain-containing protein [Corynebacterium callunae]|uniref:LytR C-terminal domain-containing protein n=1 Tax=Corynebacterium callunae TaxID=1721 RepID=UPI00398275E8